MEEKDLSLDKRLMLILNPVSGRKQAIRILPEIIRELMGGGFQVTTMVTGKRGDATEFAGRYGAQFDRIVSIGGDGTFSEMVSGMVRSGLDIPVGLIPAGSTDDFATCHGISSSLLEAAHGAAHGAAKQLDIGKFDDRYFCYIAAFGAFSWLSYSTPQNLKNTLGHSAYILDGLRDLSRIRSEHLRVTTAERCLEGDFIFGAVCNTSSVAGTFSLPKSSVQTDDGLFEVLLVHEPATILELQAEVSALRTQNYESPLVEFFRADRLIIEADGPVEWSLDGEKADGGKLLQIENLNRRITLVC